MTEREYKNILKDKLIKYRATLNLPQDITFGVEIEYENVSNELITLELNKESLFNNRFYDWINKIEIDLSVNNKNNNMVMNGEINSPVLKDNIRSWKNLKTALKILKDNNAVVTNQCGAHINIGAHVLGYNTTYWRNFFLLWVLYENEIYKFSSGEFLRVRVRDDYVLERHGRLLKANVPNILKCEFEPNKSNVLKYFLSIGAPVLDKMGDVSLCNLKKSSFDVDNRIEFRLPNPTLREEIWQNYINFFAKFLLACKKELDIEEIVYKIEHNQHNAIELADYVFEDNIDKDNFLIQTLKTNKIYKKELLTHISEY